MQNTTRVHRKQSGPAVKRGIAMAPELWEFVEWQAAENGERSASSQIGKWVQEKRDALVGAEAA